VQALKALLASPQPAARDVLWDAPLAITRPLTCNVMLVLAMTLLLRVNAQTGHGSNHHSQSHARQQNFHQKS
jgi:hypothetical protein